MSSCPPSRPSKRHCDDADTLLPQKIKRERSLSLSALKRRLVTRGAKRYSPLPNDCLSSCPEYKQNRAAWVARCVEELDALNLIPERKLFRDDGLIIDWKSNVPVWSDTLQPDPQDLAATIMLAHRSNAHWHRSPTRLESRSKSLVSSPKPNHSALASSRPPSKEKLPLPPRPWRKHPSNSFRPISMNLSPSNIHSSPSRSERPRFSDQAKLSDDGISSSADHRPARTSVLNQHDQALVFPKAPNGVYDPSASLYAFSVGEEEMSEMTLDYLRRYVQTFEADRASLAPAYARNASFSYRVHQIVQSTGGGASSICPSPQCFSSGTKQTRLDILTTLLTLPLLHSNAAHPSTVQVQYDMFYLGAELGMIAVCRVVISAKTVVHNFILQRKEADVEDAATEGVWPLVAHAHQILVFQTV